jgi:Electron transfer DM13
MVKLRRSAMAGILAAMLVLAGAGPAGAKVFGSGKFSGRNSYDVSGRHKIVVNDGKRTLRFNKAFHSDGGPGLRVWLSKAGPKSGDSALQSNYIDLGSLKAATGKQKYKIPKGRKLGKFKSVVVWCSTVAMAFGVAPIKKS